MTNERTGLMYAYSYKVNIVYYYRDSTYFEDDEKSSIFLLKDFRFHIFPVLGSKNLKVAYP